MTQSMTFSNRIEAGERLAEKLKQKLNQKLSENQSKLGSESPLVLGVPRGAVPMAKVIAERLKGELDVLLVHKVGHPDHAEYAVASVSEEGDLFMSEGAWRSGLSEEDVRPAAEREIAELRERRRLFTPDRGPIDPRGRVCIVVDDGIATGATMTAGVRSLLAKGAAHVIVATPVASEQAVTKLEDEGAEVVSVFVPRVFFSVGQFYEDFTQVSTDEAAAALRAGEKPRGRHPSPSGHPTA